MIHVVVSLNLLILEKKYSWNKCLLAYLKKTFKSFFFLRNKLKLCKWCESVILDRNAFGSAQITDGRSGYRSGHASCSGLLTGAVSAGEPILSGGSPSGPRTYTLHLVTKTHLSLRHVCMRWNVTNSTDLWKAYSCLGGQDIPRPCLLWNPKLHYRICTSRYHIVRK
jgi:hypothetical protein